MGSHNCLALLGLSVLEVVTEACFSQFQGVVLSLWFPYTLPTCLQIVPLSNSRHMTKFVLIDFMEKSHMDKAGENFSSSLT